MGLLDPLACDAARSYLAKGHAPAAADVLLKSPHREHRAVRRMLLECQDALLAEAALAVDQHDAALAGELIAVAQRCGPLRPAGLALKNRIQTALQEQPPESPPPPHAAPRRRPLDNRWLSFLIAQQALVTAAPVAVMGLAGGYENQLPIYGPVHRRHALLVRQAGRYWLGRHPGHDDRVAVNGKSAADFHPLADGDRIELGAQSGQQSSTWLFRLPVAASGTAVLIGDEHRFLVPGGWILDRAILLDDELIVRRGPPAHLEIPELPCEQLTFRWTDGGLTVAADDGLVFEESGDDWHQPPVPLHVPARLVVDSPSGMPQRIIEQLAGHSSAKAMTLVLHDATRGAQSVR